MNAKFDPVFASTYQQQDTHNSMVIPAVAMDDDWTALSSIERILQDMNSDDYLISLMTAENVQEARDAHRKVVSKKPPHIIYVLDCRCPESYDDNNPDHPGGPIFIKENLLNDGSVQHNGTTLTIILTTSNPDRTIKEHPEFPFFQFDPFNDAHAERILAGEIPVFYKPRPNSEWDSSRRADFSTLLRRALSASRQHSFRPPQIRKIGANGTSPHVI